MTSKYPVSGNKNKQNQFHSGHMWMMVLCCGVPIVGLFAIATIGISEPSLEVFLLLVCPVGMVGMMYMMHRDGREKSQSQSCCKTENEKAQSTGSTSGVLELSPVKLQPKA